tara:strand:- start:901 stop:1203 length:303 start_codon:yes stop_codon:yes gene_type:complete
MLTVFLFVIFGIGLLAFSSNKHFKLVALFLERKSSRKRKVFTQKTIRKSMRIGGWLLVGLSLVATFNTPGPLSISLVWWFALVACAILLVAMIISQKSPR